MASKQDLKLQNDYNEALKLSQSVTAAITKDLDGQIDKRTVLGKKVKDYLNDLRSSVTELQTSEDVQKKIVENEKEIEKITKSYFGANKKVGEEKIKALQTVNRSLAIEGQRLDLIERVDEQAQELNNSLSSALDGFTDSIKEVPVFGKVFGFFGDYASGILKDKIGGAAKQFTTDFAANLRSGQGAMEALSGAGGSAGRALISAFTGPQAIIAAIVVLIGAAIYAFYKVAEAATKFREETGLLNSQTKQLEGNIVNVYDKTAALGASMEDVASAAASYSKEFGNIEQASQEVLGSIVTLNKNFGVGVDEAVQLNKVFQNIGGLTAEQSQYLIGQAVSMAKIAGVAPGQVIKDMAESSEYAYRYFQGSPEKLAEAAVQAAKLGTSIKEAGKVADGLLDFESSITKELEASAILGTNLNLSRSRGLAAQGKVLEAQQAVNDEVAKLGDLTKLNKWQQDALTEATGMEFESLVNQQRIRERFGNLDQERLNAALALMQTGKDISQISKEDLAVQAEEMAKQQEMQNAFAQMGNEIAAIGAKFLTYLAPVGQFLFALIKGFLQPMMAGLDNLFGAIGKLFAPFKEIFGDDAGSGFLDIITMIGAVMRGPIMFAVNLVAGVINSIANVFGGIVKIFKGDFAEGLGMIFQGILGFILRIPIAVYDTIVGIFPALGKWMESLVGQIKGYLADLLPGWAQKLLGISGSVTSTATPEEAVASATGQNSSPTPSVNDGVMQDGKVISTSPEDFLIATKNPGSLAESMGGMPSISMEGVIQELRLLKEAFLSNKDVYMDTVKVTSVVRKTTERASDNKFGTLQA